jgi:tetratricopeptide (TPR) repeat protein
LLKLLTLLLLPTLALAPLVGPIGGASAGDPFLDKYLGTAERLRSEGDLIGARAAVEKALERDDQHLGALKALAELSAQSSDKDMAVWAYHRWLQVVDASSKSGASKSQRKAVLASLELLDVRAEDFRRLSKNHLSQLHKLAKDHVKKGRLHSALEIYAEMLLADPYNREARSGIKGIRRGGGQDVAVEDAFAGAGNPTEGLDPEWLAEENAKHDTWDTAWEKDTENYRYKTDGGFLVMQTSSIAMEQMNRAYRKFFHYKEDGGTTPKIGVWVYKTRDEYLKENGLPENDWTGGFFNGSTVQTYLGGPSGKETIRQMYGTLFHEAAHQFVSLTGRGGVPGWLNEAYASFFEGTTILSNGSVRWNQVATHRLFPLARRMDQGWMESASDGVRDESGEWATPATAPTLRILVTNEYRWGPPWYAPTWGVVYFLYNYRDDDGQLVYRESLNNYYYSNANSVGKDNRVEHFVEVVLKGAKLSPVQTIDELNELWLDWILELRDIQLGKRAARKSNFDHGSAALERGEVEAAVDFLEEAFLHQPEDPEVLWKLAGALESQKELDRASGLYLQFSRELELRGKTDDPRYLISRDKLQKLDPLFRRHAALKQKMLVEGLELARSYRSRKMPLMALEIARRMSAQFSLPEALNFYAEVASETGRSLARWKIAYNELNLSDWSGSDSYSAYGRTIEAKVVDDGASGRVKGEFFTADLTYDRAFDGDYSLEAEIRLGENTSMVGLCFGRKDDNTTHAVILHPSGFLDISTKDGGTWTYMDHRTIALQPEWQKLRIDVVGKVLDVYLNDAYLRSLEMPSRDSLQGGIGLITGTGEASFRSLRFLARDPYDPAARIERKLALEAVANATIDRPTGTFSGATPPELPDSLMWLQGDPLKLADLRGRPGALIYWSENQEKIIPSAVYYNSIIRSFAPFDYKFVVVIGGEHSPNKVKAMLKQHPLEGAWVALDTKFEFYKASHVVPEGWGMPRILVLDVDGKVTWEGDPGLLPGVGWKEGDGKTYLDGPLEMLADKHGLKQLYQFLPAGPKAQKLYLAGMYKLALETARPLADLKADFAPEVRAARDLIDRIEGDGANLMVLAEQAETAGFPLRAEAYYLKVEAEFSGGNLADLATARLKSLKRTSASKQAHKAWRILEKMIKAAGKEKPAGELLVFFTDATALSELPEITETIADLRKALFSDGHEALLKKWGELLPDSQVSARLTAFRAEN